MNRKDLARHLLFHLTQGHLQGRRLNLQELVNEVKVRRADVRATLTLLHQQGLYDAVRCRLTMTGFALGIGLRREVLPVLRPKKQPQVQGQCRAA